MKPKPKPPIKKPLYFGPMDKLSIRLPKPYIEWAKLHHGGVGKYTREMIEKEMVRGLVKYEQKLKRKEKGHE